MAYHTITIPPPKKRIKSIEEVPDELLYRWSARLFALINLTWDYIDTICDLCILYKPDGTKRLVRQIRELKREYDRFRWGISDSQFEKEESDRAFRFEESFHSDFTRATEAITLECNKIGLNGAEREIFIATQQALTLMDAVKLYAKWCDKKIAEFDVWVCDCCMVQTEFLKLYPIIPEFIRKPQYRYLKCRQTSAQILSNRMHIFNQNI